jgi:hypothetical protein
MHTINEANREANYVLFVCSNNMGFVNKYSPNAVINAVKMRGIDLTKTSYTAEEMRATIYRINQCCGCNKSTINGSIGCTECQKPICATCVLLMGECPSCKCQIHRKTTKKQCSGIVGLRTNQIVTCGRSNITKKCGFCRETFYCNENISFFLLSES